MTLGLIDTGGEAAEGGSRVGQVIPHSGWIEMSTCGCTATRTSFCPPTILLVLTRTPASKEFCQIAQKSQKMRAVRRIHWVRIYAFPGLHPEKWPPRGSPVGAGSVRRFRAGDRAPPTKDREIDKIVNAHPVRAYGLSEE